jgi:hypothetical protein
LFRAFRHPQTLHFESAIDSHLVNC